MTTILTLRLDALSQQWFDEQRRAHYPARLNQIAAHLTLFHSLPGGDAVHSTLQHAAGTTPNFALQVAGLRSLGRGVAYTLESAELRTLHRSLAQTFSDHLTPQDRQGFRPHVVIQNKATSDAARALLSDLKTSFEPRVVNALGLEWWEYLGGPWRSLEFYPFLA